MKTAMLIPGTMSCTEELGMSKASDSTQYDSAVCASCLKCIMYMHSVVELHVTKLRYLITK